MKTIASVALYTCTLANLQENIGREIAVCGRIYKIRAMSGFAFVLLQTETMLLQCLYEPEVACFALSELSEQAYVRLQGVVVSEPKSRIGLELRLTGCEILSEPVKAPPLPVNGKELNASLETLLSLRLLTLRHEKERALFRLQSGLCRGFRAYFESNGFTEIHTPKLTSQTAESGASQFTLDYFGQKACLAQSPQLYKQMLAGVFGRVYEIGPVFRAEPHDTARHLNEYTSVDAEIAGVTAVAELMALETAMLKSAFALLEAEYQSDLALCGVTLPAITEIPSVTFAEAKTLLGNLAEADDDLSPAEEKALCRRIAELTGSEFVFVTEYPSAKRPFYAMDCAGRESVTESFDLLFRGMEITTGGLRIHEYEKQVAKMRSRNLNPAAFEHYLSAHAYGLPPHGGFGLGLERMTALLAGFENVRRGCLFPRDASRLNP